MIYIYYQSQDRKQKYWSLWISACVKSLKNVPAQIFCWLDNVNILQGATPVEQATLPEGTEQIFVMSPNISDMLKEDLAWATYILLRNTNTISVVYIYAHTYQNIFHFV